MEAFDHIKDQIDRIYKELTRSDNFRQGGSAYLTLEDQDVLLLQPGLAYSRNPTSTASSTTLCLR